MPDKASVAIDTVPLPDVNVVRVTIPAKVAFNLGSMQKVTASILERLGCPGCHSAFDIRFDIARRFIVDEKLTVRDVVAGVVVTEG